MANLVCLLTHCARGDELIVGHQAHIFLFEAGSSAAVGGIHPRTVPNQPDGTLALDDIREALRDPKNTHHPRSRLICLENTHNRCSGAVLTPEYMHGVQTLARQHDLSVHLDGARIFNAATALGIEPTELTVHADSVSFCLSKGLSAPVGSLVCGARDFVQEARRQRKMLGGGMRQAGVLAAAGIVALETMVERLSQDHATAQRLAHVLARQPGIVLDPGTVQTNIVILDLSPDAPPASVLAERLRARGVLVGAIGARRLRAVTHYGVEDEDIDYAVAVAQEVLEPRMQA
jgi:threonine aldolase